MPETILITLAYCRYKKYTIKPLFQTKAIYFILMMEIIYGVLQIGLFQGHYEIVKYAGLLKSIYLWGYLGLIIKYTLYKQALFGSLWMVVGGFCNRLAIAANNGKMPVFPSLSYRTGYVKPESFQQTQELAHDFHILGDGQTQLKILTDYIDIGYSILSIGDVMIRLFVFLILYHSVKQMNERLKIESHNKE